MRKNIIFAIVIIGLFLVACSSKEQDLKQDAGVKLFYALNDHVEYAHTSFSGDTAKAVADLVKTECPQGVGDSFTRSTFSGAAYTYTVYSAKNGTLTCAVLKANQLSGIVMKHASEAPNEATLIMVNGKAITKDDLRAAANALPKGTTLDSATIAQLADSLVDKELLAQESAKINVTPEEVSKVRTNVLGQLNIDEKALPALLQKQGIDQSTFDAQVEQQARLEKLLAQKLLTKEIEVSDDVVKSYYLNNPNQFLVTDQAIMRHIFIKGTPEQYAAKAQTVELKLKSTDFCELVKQYSDDAQSVAQCGIYTIPRGVIDPALERAAFTTPVNETSIVKTTDGVHFVQTLRVTQAQVVPYSQIAGTLQTNMRNAIFQQRLNLYLTTLRAQANITTYLG